MTNRTAARRSRGRLACVVACAVAMMPLSAAAVELQPRTREAFDAYLEQARRHFLQRLERSDHAPLRADEIWAAPAHEDGIVSVPGGLIHHWVGRTYVRGVSLAQVVAVSKAYQAYSRIYKPIIASRLLEHNGNTFRVLMRLKEGEAGITAILDVRSKIEYVGPANRRAYSLSDSEEVREVRNPGRRDEWLLPAGRDSGYLWRASTFTRFLEQSDGVYVELETLGLSRRFPAMLSWFIEPIARRMGRKSAETTLREFSAAIKSWDPRSMTVAETGAPSPSAARPASPEPQ